MQRLTREEASRLANQALQNGDRTREGQNYGLQRPSIGANDYTLGIAECDIENRENPQEASKYASDLFQRLFNEEVRTTGQTFVETFASSNDT